MFPIILASILYVNLLLVNAALRDDFECPKYSLGDEWKWNFIDLMGETAMAKDNFIFLMRRNEPFELSIALSEVPSIAADLIVGPYAEKMGDSMLDKYVLKFEVSPAFLRVNGTGNVHQYYELRTIFKHFVDGKTLAQKETDPIFYATEDDHAFWISWTEILADCENDDGSLGHKCDQKLSFGVGDITSENKIDEISSVYNDSVDVNLIGLFASTSYDLSMCNGVNYVSSTKTIISNAGLGEPYFPTDFLTIPGYVPPGYDCIQVLDISETNNYFCWKTGFIYPGAKWSSEGVIKGMECTLIVESSAKSQNYLCVPANSKDHFTWSTEGELTGRSCIQWSDESAWSNNFLCSLYPDALFPKDFKWFSSDVPDGFDCIATAENHFCWRSNRNNPGVKWSSSGSINGMYCTQIMELEDADTCLDDSFLCVPRNSELRFNWIRTGNCIQAPESDSAKESQSFLCHK